jgi:hypothetical protein
VLGRRDVRMTQPSLTGVVAVVVVVGHFRFIQRLCFLG